MHPIPVYFVPELVHVDVHYGLSGYVMEVPRPRTYEAPNTQY
jgi:hypothetical protein